MRVEHGVGLSAEQSLLFCIMDSVGKQMSLWIATVVIALVVTGGLTFAFYKASKD